MHVANYEPNILLIFAYCQQSISAKPFLAFSQSVEFCSETEKCQQNCLNADNEEDLWYWRQLVLINRRREKRSSVAVQVKFIVHGPSIPCLRDELEQQMVTQHALCFRARLTCDKEIADISWWRLSIYKPWANHEITYGSLWCAIIQRWRTNGTRAQSGTRDDFAWHAPYSWDKRFFLNLSIMKSLKSQFRTSS